MADRKQPARRGPDLVTFVMGLLALGTAVAALLDGMSVSQAFDARWLLAAGAALLGVVLLAGTLGSRRR